MPSINLLPKNIKFETELIKSEKSNVAFAVSLLIILLAILFFGGLSVSNHYALEKIDALNLQIKTADEEIEKEVFDNKFLIAEVKAKKNNLLLAKRVYFTKALNLIRNSLTKSVYLNNLSVATEEEFVIFELNGIAKNYQSIASQVYIFKNLPSVRSVNITNVSVDDKGYKEFEMILKFKEEILFYEN
ncbi:MAG: hypothetical protein U9N04_03610 [Patescibacteria group bacterium]|nr:hypothetical protein [Patescibacteria group bacterium]